MADFTIKRGDRIPAIALTMDPGEVSIPSLAGSSARFKLRLVDAADGSTPRIDAAATSWNSATRVLTYEWGAGDTSDEGSYYAEGEVTLADGRKVTFPNDGYVTVDIVSDLG